MQDENYLQLILGPVRKLTDDEQKRISEKIPDQNFRYVVLSECVYIDTRRKHKIVIPEGFLTDGCSGPIPDYGRSWLFHDYLYASHCYEDNIPITRKEADNVMKVLLNYEHFHFAGWISCRVACLNPFYLWSKAWDSSGKRGPVYLKDFESVEFLN
jgi:hypothetical protein